jgi:adenine phosphoribosyltransferase
MTNEEGMSNGESENQLKRIRLAAGAAPLLRLCGEEFVIRDLNVAFPVESLARMNSQSLDLLRSTVRDVPDFPQPGILFKDITPVLSDGALLKLAVDAMQEFVGDQRVDKVVGIDARGFIFGAMLAARLGCGFVPARKKGKLPWRTRGVDYALEYGTASLELHEDAVLPGERVVLADDLLATGGTAAAALELLQHLEADIVGSFFFIELDFLSGREKVEKFAPVKSVLNY